MQRHKRINCRRQNWMSLRGERYRFRDALPAAQVQQFANHARCERNLPLPSTPPVG